MHSAEGYISSLWTVSIDRLKTEDLYLSIIELLKGTLSDQYLQDTLSSETRPIFIVRKDIDCVPMPILFNKLDTLREYLDENIDSENKWSWGMIRDNLEACQIYVSWRAITIRRQIPPTFTHKPFSDANQRIWLN